MKTAINNAILAPHSRFEQFFVDINKKTLDIYMGFLAEPSEKNISELVENYISTAIGSNIGASYEKIIPNLGILNEKNTGSEYISGPISLHAKDFLEYFLRLILAYSVLEFHKEWCGFEGDNTWYITQRARIESRIQSKKIESWILQGHISNWIQEAVNHLERNRLVSIKETPSENTNSLNNLLVAIRNYTHQMLNEGDIA